MSLRGDRDRLTVYLPTGLIRALKQKALDGDTSVSKIVEELVNGSSSRVIEHNGPQR